MKRGKIILNIEGIRYSNITKINYKISNELSQTDIKKLIKEGIITEKDYTIINN